MVQLQLEAIPMVAGFSIGAAMFVFKRLVPLKIIRQGCGKSTEEALGFDQDSQRDGNGTATGSTAEAVKPGPEPGPEPLPAAEVAPEAPASATAKEPESPREQRSGTLKTVLMHVAAVLFLALCWAPVLYLGIQAKSGPQAAVQPRGDTLLLQRAEYQPAPATSVESDGPLDSESAIASDEFPESLKPHGAGTAAVGEQADPETDVEPLEAEEEAAYINADGEAVYDEGALEEENPYPAAYLNTTSQVITMALTRQQMAMPTKDNTIYYKSAYWGVIDVGSPPVPFKVVFDTGSGHLILPSSYCHSHTCRAHTRYRRSQSSTAADIDHDGSIVAPGTARDQITISFGTGEVTGVFIEDIVCTRELTMEEIDIIENGQELPTGCMQFRLIAATDMSEDPFETFHFDGVLGLGLKGLSQAPEFNFLHMLSESLASSKAQHPHTFGIFLAQNDQEESEVTIGGYGMNHISGDVMWNPVLLPELGHWMVEIKSITVDDEPVTFCKEGCRAVLDTGTSLLAVPTASFPEIFELLRHLPEPGVTDCTGNGPKLNIQLEALTITMEPEDYARVEQRNRKSHSGVVPTTNQSNRTDWYCKPMLMSMNLPEPIGPKLFILGEPVLRKYYTVFDSKTPRIGFARATHVGPIKAWPAESMVESA